ncbi:MAG: hypothetical protein ACFB00_05220 [Parvularculaceae bacterium]
MIAILVLSACAGQTPPSEPPSYTPPPAVATDGFVSIVVEADFPMDLEAFRVFLAEESLIDYLEPVGDVSPPVAGEVLRGEWPTPGAARRGA